MESLGSKEEVKRGDEGCHTVAPIKSRSIKEQTSDGTKLGEEVMNSLSALEEKLTSSDLNSLKLLSLHRQKVEALLSHQATLNHEIAQLKEQ